MDVDFGHNYNGYLYFASAVPDQSGQLWQARVSIAKPTPGVPKDVKEQFFTGFHEPFDGYDAAIAAAEQLAKKLIDGVVPGLNI
ncbi:hypothetical protein [Janthinobacterium lividum]|nr:hypothetical protein [Janthinobacterium lividum]MDQ4684071.1 hypothetical protein [Janthinobacterium lividum]